LFFDRRRITSTLDSGKRESAAASRAHGAAVVAARLAEPGAAGQRDRFRAAA